MEKRDNESIEKNLKKTPAEKYRESLRTFSEELINKEKSEPRKIKNEPDRSFSVGKATFYGIIAGVVLGVPIGMETYHYANNLPVGHNYITVKERNEGITDRKDHDSDKYIQYLTRKAGLTEEEAEEKVKHEEELGVWDR